MKAMLKLTNSFCRYLTVTFESNTHVKNYSRLSHVKEVQRASSLDYKLKRQFKSCTNLQKHNNSKKKIKIPSLKLDEFNTTVPMSAVRLPSNTSYGGTIIVSSDDDSSAEDPPKKPPHKSKPGSSKIKIPPNFRQWEDVSQAGQAADSNDLFTFKVVSYNVLAQYLLESHPHLYTGCKTRDLKWKLRSARLYDEIVTLAPDILCLQEVQVSHMNSFYSKFEKLGYKGVFKQKTDSNRHDGCAIYFKRSAFELVDKLTVEYYQPYLPILNRHNVGVMVKLVPRHAPHCPIVVATTHLLYNPKRTDVRLAQIRLFLAEIDRFAFFNNGVDCGHLPIILTGDFNAPPDSEVIKLLSDGHACSKTVNDKSDWERVGITDNCQHLSVYLNRRAGNNTEFRQLQIYNSDYSGLRRRLGSGEGSSKRGPYYLLFNSGDIWLMLQFASAYDKFFTEGISEATTYQDQWITVDYIYYSRCCKLRPLNRLRLPTAEECSVLNRLPNEVYASDHLALAVVFELNLFGSNHPL